MAPLPRLRVLERTRASIIFAAIALRKPTIMAQPNWKLDPWRLHPERVDSLKLLFDIVADFPGLSAIYEESDASVASEIWYKLRQRACSLLRDLDLWKTTWVSDSSHAAHEVPAPPTTPFVVGEDGSVSLAWSTILHYKSLYYANTMTVYHGALIMVLRFIDSIDRILGEPEECITRQDRIEAAGFCVCRSVDYHQEEHWGEQGNFALLFPLRLAYEAVGPVNSEVRAWIEDVLHKIATGRRGLWKSAANLLSIGVGHTETHAPHTGQPHLEQARSRS